VQRGEKVSKELGRGAEGGGMWRRVRGERMGVEGLQKNAVGCGVVRV
jgi:hypothetical protein